MKIQEITFQKIEGSVVILSKNGSHFQHEAWLRREEVFCKVGAGFVGLRKENTSVMGLRLVDYDLGDAYEYAHTHTGRMVLRSHEMAAKNCPSTMFGADPITSKIVVTLKKRISTKKA